MYSGLTEQNPLTRKVVTFWQLLIFFFFCSYAVFCILWLPRKFKGKVYHSYEAAYPFTSSVFLYLRNVQTIFRWSLDLCIDSVYATNQTFQWTCWMWGIEAVLFSECTFSTVFSSVEIPVFRRSEVVWARTFAYVNIFFYFFFCNL